MARTQRAVQPRSMVTGAPLKARPPGPSRKDTTPATSAGSMSRLTAWGWIASSRTCSSGIDHITPPAQVFALADAVATPAKRITRRMASGGHLGLFTGTEAVRDHWPVVIASVLEHSRPRRGRCRGAQARPRAHGRFGRLSRASALAWRERGTGRA